MGVSGIAQRPVRPGLGFCLVFCLGLCTMLAAVPPAWSQEAPTAEAIVSALSAPETPADLDVPALRLAAAERIKKKTDNVALKRPPLSRELKKLPHIDVDIQFNPDSPVIRPESYRLVGRLADVLSSPPLMSSTFLILSRTDANGKRDSNLALSQRRAEAIRDALVTTFRISGKRLVALGLGEEQLIDPDHPKAAVNSLSSIATLK